MAVVRKTWERAQGMGSHSYSAVIPGLQEEPIVTLGVYLGATLMLWA